MSDQAAQNIALEFVLNRSKPANLAKLPADIQYLLDDKVGLVLSEGLNVLYRTKPKHPIDFFAKWLLNFEATEKNKTVVHEAGTKVNKILEQYDKLAEVRKQKEQQQEQIKQKYNQAETQFREKLKSHNYHEELLANDLPSFVEKQRKIPAVYIGMLEHPTRAVGDDEDDEYAHLDTTQPKLISYVGASGNQKYVLGKELQPETGVTYDVFIPKEEEPPVEVAEGEEPPIVVKPPNYLYVPDVTREPRMVFFRIPKLGAFLVHPLSYKSVLSEKALDEGAKERQRFQVDQETQKKDKEERDEEYQKKIQEAQDQEQEQEAIDALEEEWKNFEWPDIAEREFEFEERKFVLCVDTLGEDREFTEEEKVYVTELAEYFVQCWEESEKRQLSRDIDLLLESQKNVNREEFIDKLNQRLADEIHAQYQEDENDSELKQNYKKAAITAEFYRTRLLEDDVKAMIKNLTEYRVVKFKPLIQNVMYFLGYKKGQINVPGTNLLEWKEVKRIFGTEDFFRKLEEYEFKGPKEGYWEIYALTNRLAQKLEKINPEELEEYNLGLVVLYKFVKQIVDTRLLDVQLRRTEKEEQKKKREELIQEAENLVIAREAALEEAQAKHAEKAAENEGEEEEPFNLEEWNTRWDEDHPAIVIPDEVVDDIDEDIEPENVE